MQVASRSFVVTGGASGLGAACVRRLIACQGSVVVADLNEAGGQALAEELGERAAFVRTDVTSAEGGQGAIDAAIQRFGGLHGLINCAGILGAARLVGRDGPHDLELFRKVIEVNLSGTFNMLRLAAAAMSLNVPDAQGERGVIIIRPRSPRSRDRSARPPTPLPRGASRRSRCLRPASWLVLAFASLPLLQASLKRP